MEHRDGTGNIYLELDQELQGNCFNMYVCRIELFYQKRFSHNITCHSCLLSFVKEILGCFFLNRSEQSENVGTPRSSRRSSRKSTSGVLTPIHSNVKQETSSARKKLGMKYLNAYQFTLNSECLCYQDRMLFTAIF